MKSARGSKHRDLVLAPVARARSNVSKTWSTARSSAPDVNDRTTQRPEAVRASSPKFAYSLEVETTVVPIPAALQIAPPHHRTRARSCSWSTTHRTQPCGTEGDTAILFHRRVPTRTATRRSSERGPLRQPGSHHDARSPHRTPALSPHQRGASMILVPHEPTRRTVGGVCRRSPWPTRCRPRSSAS